MNVAWTFSPTLLAISRTLLDLDLQSKASIVLYCDCSTSKRVQANTEALLIV